MYENLQKHRKTNKGKSLVSQLEVTLDAQIICQELVKHALISNSVVK
jgi:hypothetical protein